jgi:hypothetical protein
MMRWLVPVWLALGVASALALRHLWRMRDQEVETWRDLVVLGPWRPRSFARRAQVVVGGIVLGGFVLASTVGAITAALGVQQ